MGFQEWEGPLGSSSSAPRGGSWGVLGALGGSGANEGLLGVSSAGLLHNIIIMCLVLSFIEIVGVGEKISANQRRVADKIIEL